jgi:hypothetical protein
MMAATGRGPVSQAKDTIGDLQQRFGATLLLGEFKAALAMRAAQFAEALQTLKQVRALARSSKVVSAGILVNSIVCLEQLGDQFPNNEAVRAKLLQELRQLHPADPYFSQLQQPFH